MFKRAFVLILIFSMLLCPLQASGPVTPPPPLEELWLFIDYKQVNFSVRPPYKSTQITKITRAEQAFLENAFSQYNRTRAWASGQCQASVLIKKIFEILSDKKNSRIRIEFERKENPVELFFSFHKDRTGPHTKVLILAESSHQKMPKYIETLLNSIILPDSFLSKHGTALAPGIAAVAGLSLAAHASTITYNNTLPKAYQPGGLLENFTQDFAKGAAARFGISDADIFMHNIIEKEPYLWSKKQVQSLPVISENKKLVVINSPHNGLKRTLKLMEEQKILTRDRYLKQIKVLIIPASSIKNAEASSLSLKRHLDLLRKFHWQTIIINNGAEFNRRNDTRTSLENIKFPSWRHIERVLAQPNIGMLVHLDAGNTEGARLTEKITPFTGPIFNAIQRAYIDSIDDMRKPYLEILGIPLNTDGELPSSSHRYMHAIMEKKGRAAPEELEDSYQILKDDTLRHDYLNANCHTLFMNRFYDNKSAAYLAGCRGQPNPSGDSFYDYFQNGLREGLARREREDKETRQRAYREAAAKEAEASQQRAREREAREAEANRQRAREREREREEWANQQRERDRESAAAREKEARDKEDQDTREAGFMDGFYERQFQPANYPGYQDAYTTAFAAGRTARERVTRPQRPASGFSSGGASGGTGAAPKPSAAPSRPTTSSGPAVRRTPQPPAAPTRPRRTHYETLGVADGATEEVVKKAYKKLMLTHHPDRTFTAHSRRKHDIRIDLSRHEAITHNRDKGFPEAQVREQIELFNTLRIPFQRICDSMEILGAYFRRLTEYQVYLDEHEKRHGK